MSTKTFFRPAQISDPARRQDDAALLVAEHAVVDVGGAVQVAELNAMCCHRFDDRDDAGVLRDVDVLDGLAEVFRLVGVCVGLERFDVEGVVGHGATPARVEEAVTREKQKSHRGPLRCVASGVTTPAIAGRVALRTKQYLRRVVRRASRACSPTQKIFIRLRALHVVVDTI